MTPSSKNQKPIFTGLFERFDEGVRLIGSRCLVCDEVNFPATAFCPQCCRDTAEKIALSQRGLLYSFTIQRFRPPPPYKGPENFDPYAVGMIELPEGLRVTSLLEGCDPSEFRVGMEMELVIAKLFEDDKGCEVLGYKFKPIEGDLKAEERAAKEGHGRQ
jgi:uncharacterized OB-fold protein